MDMTEAWWFHTSFRPQWEVRPAAKSTSIWICRPMVPGGAMRFSVMDDFGNLLCVSVESASHSLS